MNALRKTFVNVELIRDTKLISFHTCDFILQEIEFVVVVTLN